jgi:NADPH:quinone reductase-like Zn-dependent oxidoreductase
MALAAITPGTKKPLEVHEVDTYKPGPHELLVKNEVIAFNPMEFKVRVGEGVSKD